MSDLLDNLGPSIVGGALEVEDIVWEVGASRLLPSAHAEDLILLQGSFGGFGLGGLVVLGWSVGVLRDLDLADGRGEADSLLRAVIQKLLLGRGWLAVGLLPLHASMCPLLKAMLLDMLVEDGAEGGDGAGSHGGVGGIGVGGERSPAVRHGGRVGGDGEGGGRERYGCHVRMVVTGTFYGERSGVG